MPDSEHSRVLRSGIFPGLAVADPFQPIGISPASGVDGKGETVQALARDADVPAGIHFQPFRLGTDILRTQTCCSSLQTVRERLELPCVRTHPCADPTLQ